MAPFSADSLSALRRKHRLPLVLELPSGRYRANRGPAWQRNLPLADGSFLEVYPRNQSGCQCQVLVMVIYELEQILGHAHQTSPMFGLRAMPTYRYD